ncbi:MAG TPA: hypothetical protein VFU59_08210 [Candidatus Eisenbacteria bacterium]|nr:hypothetical protein [Candidatus Eisenbacteria bacterium]
MPLSIFGWFLVMDSLVGLAMAAALDQMEFVLPYALVRVMVVAPALLVGYAFQRFAPLGHSVYRRYAASIGVGYLLCVAFVGHINAPFIEIERVISMHTDPVYFLLIPFPYIAAFLGTSLIYHRRLGKART